MGFQVSFWGVLLILAIAFSLVGLGMMIERSKNDAAWDKFYEGAGFAKNRRAN